MKKILAIAAFVFAALLFTTCDKVEGPYYVINNVEDVNVDFPDLDQSTVYRKIFFEEFTGHHCSNCPDGHEKLEELHQRFGDTLVAMGIHFGATARPFGEVYSYDFRTEAGTRIAESFDIDAIPAAIINRVYEYQGWPRTQWMNEVSKIDRSKIPAALQLINEYDENSKTVKANVKITMLQNYSAPLRLAVFLLEDGIVKPQLNGTQTIEDYVHNHVLRAALTDPFGYMLRDGDSPWSSGDSETFAISIKCSDTDWNLNNCTIVAVLLDAMNGSAIQVEQSKVINQ